MSSLVTVPVGVVHGTGITDTIWQQSSGKSISGKLLSSSARFNFRIVRRGGHDPPRSRVRAGCSAYLSYRRKKDAQALNESQANPRLLLSDSARLVGQVGNDPTRYRLKADCSAS